MGDQQILYGFVFVIVLIVVWYFISSTVRLLNVYERVVILRLGHYIATRGPGITIVLPFIERATRVDLREKPLDIPLQTVTTKDNALVDIDFLLSYRIVDPKLSVLYVENVDSTLNQIAITILRAIISDSVVNDVLNKREDIKERLHNMLNEAAERWGTMITMVEIREIIVHRQ